MIHGLNLVVFGFGVRSRILGSATLRPVVYSSSYMTYAPCPIFCDLRPIVQYSAIYARLFMVPLGMIRGFWVSPLRPRTAG